MAEQTQAEQAAKQQPSGQAEGSSAIAGAGEAKVNTNTPEKRDGKINPSAPNDGITPPMQ